MRRAFPLLAAVLVAGCAAMSNGSWLDHVGQRPNPPVAMSDEQAQALTQEVARLQAQAQALRVQLAAEPDRLRRLDILSELRRLGDRSRPLEDGLRNAGRPVPYDTAAKPA